MKEAIRDINLPKMRPMITKRFYYEILQSKPKITHHTGL